MDAIATEPVQPHPAFHPELGWLEQTVTTSRLSLWHSAEFGKLYEAPRPRAGADTELGYWIVTQITGTVLGYHPEIGTVTPPASSYPTTTEVASPETRSEFRTIGNTPE